MDSNRFSFLFIFIFLIFCSSCERLDLRRQVIIETSPVENTSVTEAWITGRILDSGEDLVEFGHCWSIEANPTIKDSRTIFTNTELDTFQSTISGIEPHVFYFVRAYALEKDSTITYSSSEYSFIIQDVWIELEPFPGDPRQQAFGFSIGNKGYFGGGRRWHEVEYIVYNDFWEYNTGNGMWTKLEDLPSVNQLYSTFVINNKGYVYLNNTNQLFEYDPAVNQWFQKASLPSDIKVMPISMTINNKGYIIGGSNTNTVWNYDPGQNSWDESNNCIPRDVGVYAGIGFNIGSRYFLGGGHTRENMEVEPVYLTDFYEYDPHNEIWIDKADIGIYESYYVRSFSLGNRGYVLDYDMLWEYNPHEDEWYTVSDFPYFAKRLYPTIVTINDLAYLFGGANDPEEDLYSWYYTAGYDFSGWISYNDFWVYVPPAGFRD